MLRLKLADIPSERVSRSAYRITVVGFAAKVIKARCTVQHLHVRMIARRLLAAEYHLEQ
jgi:hypothetical protein